MPVRADSNLPVECLLHFLVELFLHIGVLCEEPLGAAHAGGSGVETGDEQQEGVGDHQQLVFFLLNLKGGKLTHFKMMRAKQKSTSL